MRAFVAAVARVYTLLLHLYPRGFRRRFGAPMAETFRQRSLELGGWPRWRFWAASFTDLLRTAFAERRDDRLLDRRATNSERAAIGVRRAAESSRFANGSTSGHTGRSQVLLADLLHDLSHAIRRSARQPAFTAVVVLTLALGIGANTAVFSVVNSVLLNPLPYDNADRMFRVWQLLSEAGGSVGLPYDRMLELRRRSRTLERIEAFDAAEGRLRGGDEVASVKVGVATPGLFDALGLAPALGRGFVESDAAADGEPVVLLGEALWRRRFGAAPDVLGRILTIDDEPRVVVGVLDESIRYLSRDVDLWVPMSEAPDSTVWLTILAWRRPGVSIERARAEMEVLAFEDERYGRVVARLLLPGDRVGDGTRALLYATLAAVSLVLLIACVNVAHLMLARGSARRREIAVRAALGAGRSRLARELLAESGLTVLAGGALGALLAVWGLDLLAAMRPASLPVRFDAVRIDATVMAYAAGVSIVAAMLSGLAPILDVSRLQPGGAMRTGGSATVAGGGGILRQGLLVAEVALSLMLLVGAGLLLHSLVRLQRVDPGYQPGDLRVVGLSFRPEHYPSARQRAELYELAAEAARGMPGIEAVALASDGPVHDFVFGGTLHVEVTDEVHERVRAALTMTTPGYFGALGIPILEGRDFDNSDVRSPEELAIVNRSFAERLFAGRSAVGQRFRRSRGNTDTAYRIVGVVGDAIQGDPLEQEEYDLQLYLPLWSLNFVSSARLSLLARIQPDSLATLAVLRERLQALDPDLEIGTEIRSVRDRLSGALALPRFNATLFGAFAAIALGLASIGLYGVVSHVVERRAREMGVRVALGARAADVRRLVLRQGMIPVAVGILLGLAGAVASGRIIAGLLYLVQPSDPLVFATVPVLLLLVALAAIWVPALRATRVDPVAVLRAE